MIPVRLQLQNFMAYRDPASLGFGDIHLACLSGENGAGKSSLLDAITWSLWGKARVSQSDDLIHLGETDMEVEFSFILAEETYRVLRRRSAAKRGKSELHFHISDAGGWRTLTEGSIRNTQAKIDRLLRLDYDTFINSAFLLQGRADEFTNKTPTDRKQILADILGLGIYDEYESLAKDERRRFDQEIAIIEGQIATIDEEVAREAEYRIELDQSQSEAARLRRELGETEHQMTDLRQQYQGLEQKRTQLDDLTERLVQATTDIEELTHIIEETEQKIADYRAIIERKSDIKKGYKALEKAQKAVDDWNQRLSKSSTLMKDQHDLTSKVDQARIRLEADIQNAETRSSELRPKIDAIPTLETDLGELHKTLVDLQAEETKRDEARQSLELLVSESATLKAENDQLKKEMDQINSRLTQLKEAGSICPICTQPLNEDHRQQVQDQFMTDGKGRGDTFRANRARQDEIQTEQTRLDKNLKALDRSLKRLPALQTQQVKKQQVLEDAIQARDSLATLDVDIVEWREKLTNKLYEVEAIAQLENVEAELSKLGYDSDAHEAVKTEVEDLAHFGDEIRQLENAETRLGEDKPRLKRDQERHARLLKQTAVDREQIDRLKEETKALDKISESLRVASRELDRLQKEERMARSAVGAAEQKLNHVSQQIKVRVEKEDKLAGLRQTVGIYRELQSAFGKSGVQALLIEHAIPELETEANNILQQMTDGRMNLQFITQRELKSKNQSLRETLDIRIADEIGTRGYELFSGGEAFRVNFAIRIALSKLLARRSGARLQTLVIDEGFGTQDSQGRERLVEAINKIQHEFEKIIVITHIDEIKDAFPARITVQKTANGSTIMVD